MATQLNNVTSIKLQGNNFSNLTTLQLFTNSNNNNLTPDTLSRVSLIYGKNGSGKSTIATAFNKIKGDGIQDITTAELIDKDNNVISLTNDDKNNIFVFNETYIDNNIRIKEDGLDTIVMLGDMVDIEKQLKGEENKKNELENEKKEQEKKCIALNDEKNENSPNFWLKKMTDNLKGQDDKGNKNWAERDFEIKQIAGENPRRATSVSDDKYKDFINLSPTKSRDALIIEYNKLLEELKTVQSGAKQISAKVPRNFSFTFDEKRFIELLSKKIEQPNLSEREKFLLSIMKEKQERHLHEIKDFFAKNENDKCPFCTQAVSSAHKQELFASIEKILSKASEEHKQELQAYKRKEITINFDDFSVLDKTIIEECCTALTQFNGCVTMINNKIEEKSGNVYQPVILEYNDIQSKFDNLISKLNQLEELRIEYNKNTTDTNSIKNKLNDINNNIAYYDICNEYKKFQEKETIKKQEDDKLKNDIKNLEECEKTIKKLIADKNKVEIAVEEINKGLQYIFFAKNRLEIEYRDKKYCLKSMGNTVKPNKISTGERNAIAMCYFFSQTMQNKEQGDYSNPYLLVIDDPVSSFDMENRIGLLSFLRYKLKQYLCGNKNTKVIVMTHDIQTCFDLQKLFEEVIECCKTDSNRYIFSRLELIDKKISQFHTKKRHEYTELIKEIYDFALNANQYLSITIGNTMRRVLEAYGSFIYKTGIEKISTDNKILSIIQDNKIVPYFENLMYRLVLHGESHMEEKVQAMNNNLDFFQFIDDNEKQRTAKFVICFLYSLNERHILNHLGEDKENQIKQWIEDIKQNTI